MALDTEVSGRIQHMWGIGHVEIDGVYYVCIYGEDIQTHYGWECHPLLSNGKRIRTSEKIEKDKSYDYEEKSISMTDGIIP